MPNGLLSKFRRVYALWKPEVFASCRMGRISLDMILRRPMTEGKKRKSAVYAGTFLTDNGCGLSTSQKNDSRWNNLQSKNGLGPHHGRVLDRLHPHLHSVRLIGLPPIGRHAIRHTFSNPSGRLPRCIDAIDDGMSGHEQRLASHRSRVSRRVRPDDHSPCGGDRRLLVGRCEAVVRSVLPVTTLLS
jgi:hypothetical protein